MKLKAILILSVLLGFNSLDLMAKEGDKYNIRIQPLYYLARIWNLDFDFKLNDEFTLGPKLAYYVRKNSGVQTSAYQAGVRANWYLQNGVFKNGWYLGPSVSYMGAEAKQDNVKASLNLWMINVIAGYHWFMNEGFNLNLGAGGTYINWPDYVLVNGKKISLDTYENMDLSIEFGIGWSF